MRILCCNFCRAESLKSRGSSVKIKFLPPVCPCKGAQGKPVVSAAQNKKVRIAVESAGTAGRFVSCRSKQ